MMSRSHPSNVRRAFTIVELLVVVVIIVIVLSILLPAIAGARQAAKRASTLALMNHLGTATNAFALDKNGRMPGYFSAAEMGSAENESRNLSAMKNMLLDLSGGLTTAAANGANILAVGPTAGNTVNVDLTQIGASTGGGNGAKSYFTPDQKFYVPQNVDGQMMTPVASLPPGHANLPDIVDSWGNPILAWVEEDRATNTFAAETSANANVIPKFYQASNACYLGARALGKSGRNQNGSADPHSLIGMGLPPAQLFGGPGGNGTFEAFLGNPAYPTRINPIRPEKARGPVVFLSAGPDGYYLSSDDRGGKIATTAGGALPYSTSDAMADFDDLVVKAGN
ncbi:MAG: prepilin-type N-terminal cleavage/methylation domain-containing protein [Phycisphaerales bacterium]